MSENGPSDTISEKGDDELREKVEEAQIDPAVLEQRLKEAEELKLIGNDEFQKENYEMAIQKYTEAIQLVPKDHEKSAIFHSNRAAAHLHLSQYKEAVADCDVALKITPLSVKAIHRRANANYQLKEYKKALEDYKKYLELNPGVSNASVQRLVDELPALIQKQEEEEKAKMMEDLKSLGNKFLGLFGMSVDNFQATQDSTTGGYSIKFNPNK
eukprot:TRINITY_DN2771_c0_g1_i2.p1 TRINITY_DN2771_c0_g1~~TRINITY_DN2771_c0_g1_i2.p1  ORF type:complete len:213 (+),score=73.06 TRINITY_DN2771_c0_g1_i2:676-1314(+)